MPRQRSSTAWRSARAATFGSTAAGNSTTILLAIDSGGASARTMPSHGSSSASPAASAGKISAPCAAPALAAARLSSDSRWLPNHRSRVRRAWAMNSWTGPICTISRWPLAGAPAATTAVTVRLPTDCWARATDCSTCAR